MALEKKVTANTTALEGKQDKGNYVAYDNDDGSEYTLQKGFDFSGKQGNYVSIDSNGVELNAIGNSILSYLGLNGNLSGSSYRIGVDGIEVREEMNSAIKIDSGSISSTTEDDTNRFLIDSNGIVIGDINNPNVDISSEGIKFAGKTDDDIPTANGTFKPISDFVLKEDAEEEYATQDQIDDIKVGLAKKQDKIKVNRVDVTNLTPSANIDQLINIVQELLIALNSSGLIIMEDGLE